MPLLSVAQSATTDYYLVLTVQKKINKYQFEGIKEYHWIIPIDSSFTAEYSAYPLLDDVFSKGDFDSCCLGKPINPFVMTTATNFNHDSSYLYSLEQFRLLIRSHRKKVQRIEKRWNEKLRETIVIYATPIMGVFCQSPLIQMDGTINSQSRLVFIPKSDFRSLDGFWKTKKGRNAAFADYTKLSTSIFGNSDQRRPSAGR